MAVLEILTAPHPVLSSKARPVRDDEFSAGLRQLLSDMAWAWPRLRSATVGE